MKSAFRPRTAPSPTYPDLDRFDKNRRSFLCGLGAAVLGSLLPLSAEAGKDPGKDPGKKKDRKKKGQGDDDKPRPPVPGGKGSPTSRLDEIEDEAWADAAGQPPKKQDKKSGKKKQDTKKQPPPHMKGDAPAPQARLDELLDGSDEDW